MRTMLLAAIGLFAIGGPAFGADVNTKPAPSSAYEAPSLPAPGVNWSGLYVLAGVAIEATTLAEEGEPIDFGTESAAILARIGYRQQRGQIVAGIFGEIQATNWANDELDDADATYRYGAGIDLGLALGGVLVSAEGGYQWLPIDGSGGFSLDLAGPFAGVKAAIDIGGGWDVGIGVRRYYLTDSFGSTDFDVYTTNGLVSISKRF